MYDTDHAMLESHDRHINALPIYIIPVVKIGSFNIFEPRYRSRLEIKRIIHTRDACKSADMLRGVNVTNSTANLNFLVSLKIVFFLGESDTQRCLQRQNYRRLR